MWRWGCPSCSLLSYFQPAIQVTACLLVFQGLSRPLCSHSFSITLICKVWAHSKIKWLCHSYVSGMSNKNHTARTSFIVGKRKLKMVFLFWIYLFPFLFVTPHSVALINHSCLPSVIVTYSGTSAEVRAVQDMKPGDEVRKGDSCN